MSALSYHGYVDSRTPAGAAPRPSGSARDDSIVAVAAGYNHNLALTRDGQVYAWGAGDSGQLGAGGNKNQATPVRVTGLPVGDPVVAISAGVAHSLALTRAGHVYTWGGNRLGQLGDGLTASSAAPVAARGLPPDDPVVAISAGGLHSLALTRRGRVYAWGADTFGQLGPAGAASYNAVPVVVALVHSSGQGAPGALAAGIAHSAAVLRDGAVRTWGDDSVGQLGYIDNSRAPLAVRGLPMGDPVVALAAGGLHNLALTRAGYVYAWGDDSAGQLGVVGQGYISSVPLAVTGVPAGTPVIAVAAGYSHSLALTRDGTVYAWGANTFGQLGDGATHDSGVPVVVRGLPPRDPVVALAGGHNDSLALTRSGRVYTWGGDANGELGHGATRESARPMPVRATWQG